MKSGAERGPPPSRSRGSPARFVSPRRPNNRSPNTEARSNSDNNPDGGQDFAQGEVHDISSQRSQIGHLISRTA